MFGGSGASRTWLRHARTGARNKTAVHVSVHSRTLSGVVLMDNFTGCCFATLNQRIRSPESHRSAHLPNRLCWRRCNSPATRNANTCVQCMDGIGAGIFKNYRRNLRDGVASGCA